jgi:hypothetical protein
MQDKPYRVVYGWGEYVDFGRFEDALAFYAKTRGASAPVNLDRYDGAEDGTDGLTEEQQEAVELA